MQSKTLTEILSQPMVWQAVLSDAKERVAPAARSFAQSGAQDLLLIGCGSTYYLSLAAAQVFRALTGRRAVAYPSSELMLFSQTVAPPSAQPALLAISRSGTTTETLRAVVEFQRRWAGEVTAITCYPDGALAGMARHVIVTAEAQEESVVQTRSFSSMYLLTQACAAALAGDAAYLSSLATLPRLAASAIDRYEQAIADLAARPFTHHVFLGSGPFYGLSCEGMLKMKESAIVHSEAYHTLEVRHGPKSIISERTLVVCNLSDTGRDLELAVVRDLRAQGATTLVICEDASAGATAAADVVVELGSALPESARSVLHLPIMQLLAYYRAVHQGIDPDHPRNLTAVVEF